MEGTIKTYYHLSSITLNTLRTDSNLLLDVTCQSPKKDLVLTSVSNGLLVGTKIFTDMHRYFQLRLLIFSSDPAHATEFGH